jgi:hypothetical protein
MEGSALRWLWPLLSEPERLYDPEEDMPNLTIVWYCHYCKKKTPHIYPDNAIMPYCKQCKTTDFLGLHTET